MDDDAKVFFKNRDSENSGLDNSIILSIKDHIKPLGGVVFTELGTDDMKSQIVTKKNKNRSSANTSVVIKGGEYVDRNGTLSKMSLTQYKT